MKITFRTNKLKKQYEDHRRAYKDYGPEIGKNYIARILIIRQAKDIGELQTLPVIHCHPLKGNRLGQWSIRLSGRSRLIFTLEGETLEIVCIEEVSKHYEE